MVPFVPFVSIYSWLVVLKVLTDLVKKLRNKFDFGHPCKRVGRKLETKRNEKSNGPIED